MCRQQHLSLTLKREAPWYRGLLAGSLQSKHTVTSLSTLYVILERVKDQSLRVLLVAESPEPHSQWTDRPHLHECDPLPGLLIEEGNALLKPFFVCFPGLQQLRLFRRISIFQLRLNLSVLQTCSSTSAASCQFPILLCVLEVFWSLWPRVSSKRINMDIVSGGKEHSKAG